ncbi:MAG TPA: TonB-dependent receptor [Opitutaceae bacterium]|nr:TonB-dependent receptor [Opitutaceae bacterium]
MHRPSFPFPSPPRHPGVPSSGAARRVSHRRIAAGFLATALGLAAPARAASTPEPAGVVELSPFTVEATSDTSYGAINSNSITSFNAELEKLPISADVLNRTFMDDTDSTTLEEMLRDYSAGAGTGSAAGDVGGIPVNQPMDRGGGDSVSAGVQLRGLGAAVVKQDSFMLPSPAGTGLNSNFGVDRVEVINGPQALLYGNGGGGGVVNIISRPARFGRGPQTTLKYQVDQYGHKLGQFDYSASHGGAAITLSLLDQELGDNRQYIGGPLRGIYGQLAIKAPHHTVIRLTGKETKFNRTNPQNMVFSAGSTAVDGRHSQNVRYLLATNQMARSATGPTTSGVIGNGYINWGNVDSYGDSHEYTTARLGELSVETNWRPWLSTQLAVGYQDKDSMIGVGSGFTFYAPNHKSNPVPGQWTAATSGSAGPSWANQPSKSESYRFSVLMTHGLFHGLGRAQTIVGGEYTRATYANENNAWYEADDHFNVIHDSTGQRIQFDVPNPYWNVSQGPVQYPFVPPGTPRITVNGVNYVSQIMNQTDPALITPQNPQGVTGTDLFIHSRAISKGAFIVNYTQWDQGRLATLAGLRWVSADNRQFASTAIPAIVATGDNLSYSVGANYAVRPWLRPYVTISDTYNLPGVLLTVPADPYGNPAPISHSVGEEAGVKVSSPGGRLSGSIAFFAVQSKDEPYSIPSQLRDSINPAGLNGRYRGATGIVIKVNRRSQGMQAAITAAPVNGWRMRLSAAVVQGTIGNDTSYKPLYNDQFYANAAGQVTYANGTVVYVRPTALSTPGTAANGGYIPLTIAKLSDPKDPYYANPNPITGLIGSSTARNVLNYTKSPNGPIKTGVAGLPISDLQLTGITPPDEIVTSRSGDHTTGYPEMSLNFTNVYVVPAGGLKGLKIGGTASFAWRLADYYYYPSGYRATATRTLLYRPTKVLFNGILGYERRFRNITWSVQLNIANMFNSYSVFIRPNSISGYAGIDQAIWTTQPRCYTLTTTFRF